jgi:hypothetical protein
MSIWSLTDRGDIGAVAWWDVQAWSSRRSLLLSAVRAAIPLHGKTSLCPDVWRVRPCLAPDCWRSPEEHYSDFEKHFKMVDSRN